MYGTADPKDSLNTSYRKATALPMYKSFSTATESAKRTALQVKGLVTRVPHKLTHEERISNVIFRHSLISVENKFHARLIL